MFLKVGFITTDAREQFNLVDSDVPCLGTAPTALLEGFKSCRELEIHVISCTQSHMHTKPKLADNIWLHTVCVSKAGWLRSGYLGCVLATRKLLRSIQPDLVHGQGTERDCAIGAWASGYTNLITVHGNIRAVAHRLHARPFSYYWSQSILEAFALKRTRGVLCNSSYTQSLVQPLNPKTYLVPNAVRGLFFTFPRSLPKPTKEGLRLLMVGVISPYKQALEFLRFLRAWKCQGNCPVAMCSWVGLADPKNLYARIFLQELSEAQSQGWAEHIQELSLEPLIKKMDQSDALIHLPNEEAFGLVVAEAMIRGLPVVTTRAGGLPEFADLYPRIRLVSPLPNSQWRDALSRDFLGSSRVQLDSWPSHRFRPVTVAQKHVDIYRTIVSCR